MPAAERDTGDGSVRERALKDHFLLSAETSRALSGSRLGVFQNRFCFLGSVAVSVNSGERQLLCPLSTRSA
jgi:hypothetical protein